MVACLSVFWGNIWKATRLVTNVSGCGTHLSWCWCFHEGTTRSSQTLKSDTSENHQILSHSEFTRQSHMACCHHSHQFCLETCLHSSILWFPRAAFQPPWILSDSNSDEGVPSGPPAPPSRSVETFCSHVGASETNEFPSRAGKCHPATKQQRMHIKWWYVMIDIGTYKTAINQPYILWCHVSVWWKRQSW